MKYTEKQIQALEYLVLMSDHGSRVVKQIFLCLLERSEGLTKPVALTLVEGPEWGSKEINLHARTQDGLVSCNGSTHLTEILRCMGSDYIFQTHYGRFNSDGEFSTRGMFVGWPEDMVHNKEVGPSNVKVS